MKRIFFTVACLYTIASLVGVIPTGPSIIASPNGHNFANTFNSNLLTSFTIHNREVITLDYDASTVLHSQNVDTVVNPLTLNAPIPISISLSGYPSGDYNISLSINDQKFVDQAMRTWVTTPIQFTTQVLSNGVHELHVEVADTSGTNIIDDVVSFAVMERDTVYRNNHFDELIVKQTHVSELNSVKPVLFVEGFPLNMDSTSIFMNSLVTGWLPSLPNSEVYLLKLKYPYVDMRDNAMVVLAALRFIHEKQLPQQLVEGTSVFGYSMGGVLARYALAFAEDNNVEHYCTQLISLDAPNRGVALNHQVQEMITDLKNAIDDLNAIPLLPNQANLAEEWESKLQTQAAKQLIRLNRFAADSDDTYLSGTSTFLAFYSEINAEERAAYYPERYVLNSGNGGKPGFPYRQNSIKCLALSNGSLQRSGNVNSDPWCMYYNLDLQIPGYDSYFHAYAEGYDYQPGSVFNDIGSNPAYHTDNFDLYQNYAPVIVPTKSSLYLKVPSVCGPFNNDYQFEMDCYENITHPNTATMEEHLLRHTYFDKLVYAPPVTDPEWNWRHGEYNASFYANNMNVTRDWINDKNNSAVGYITGTVCGSYPWTVTIDMQVNGNHYYTGQVESNGTYSLPYIYARSSNVRLVFNKPSCFPTVKNVAIRYDGGLIHYGAISVTNLFAYDLNNITVSQNGTGNFYTIGEALDYVNEVVSSDTYAQEAFRINVSGGVYTENLIILLPISQVSSIEICGTPNQTQIIGSSNSLRRSLEVSNYENRHLENFTLRNIIFAGESRAGGLMLYDNIDNVLIENCTFKDFQIPNGFQINVQPKYFYGTAIQSKSPTAIRNCKIYNNQGLYDNTVPYPWYSEGDYWGSLGIIYLTNESTVENCQIYNNSASIAGALYIKGSGSIIKNNIVYNNRSFDLESEALAIRCIEADGIQILNNVFYDNGCASELLTSGNVLSFFNCGSTISNCIVRNNTFTNYATVLPSTLTALKIHGNSIVAVTNNVVIMYQTGLFNNSGLITTNAMLHNNLFWNNTSNFAGIPYDVAANPGICLFVDPKLSTELVPRWDATTMSPCIDAGVGDNDSDGTPSDIGAYPAIQHKYKAYTMPAYGDYKWMSFPVLNRVTNGYTTNSNFFAPIRPLSILASVTWKEGRYPETSMYYNNGLLLNGHQIASSLLGYKLQLQPGVTDPPQIITPGFIQPPNTVINLYAHPIGEPSVANENWIGYFPEQSAEPFQAFSEILNYVTAIKTQRWSMKKDIVSGMWLTSSVNPTINYGDMVIVYVSQDCSFSWNTSHPVDPRVREKASGFMYTEKKDYTPLYLNLEGLEELPTEVGVYVNGVCKGAVRVEGSFTDLCAYLEEDETITTENCELVLYYASKSAGNIKQACKLKQSDISLVNDGGMQYYAMAINKDAEINPVIPVTSLQQNYPNPFNPQTTISYELAEEGLVRLVIYNIKGQLIKTLVNEPRVSGPHRILWNGTDKYGRNVASGLYYYRMTTKAGSISKKMLLMK